MGGYGSGRSGGSLKAGETKSVDIRYLRSNGYLKLGNRIRLTWSVGDEERGHIWITPYENKIVLDYKVRSYGEQEWTTVLEDVFFTWTPCNFGGQRAWLSCPGCNRRVAVIYAGGKRFLCRHCYGISYASQCETDMDRQLRKSQKIRRKLCVGESVLDPVIFKPKGMHQKTFDRLRWKLEYSEQASILALARRIGFPLD